MFFEKDFLKRVAFIVWNLWFIKLYWIFMKIKMLKRQFSRVQLNIIYWLNIRNWIFLFTQSIMKLTIKNLHSAYKLLLIGEFINNDLPIIFMDTRFGVKVYIPQIPNSVYSHDASTITYHKSTKHLHFHARKKSLDYHNEVTTSLYEIFTIRKFCLLSTMSHE